MSAETQTQFSEFRTGRLVRCVNRNGANQRLGTVAHELQAILSRPLNSNPRLTGVLNLSGPESGQDHLCFVVVCLEEFLAGITCPRTDDELSVLLFGALQKAQGRVSMKRIYQALNCSHDHLYSFTTGRRPALPLGGSKCRRGPGGSAVVQWAALVKFIGERRLA